MSVLAILLAKPYQRQLRWWVITRRVLGCTSSGNGRKSTQLCSFCNCTAGCHLTSARQSCRCSTIVSKRYTNCLHTCTTLHMFFAVVAFLQLVIVLAALAGWHVTPAGRACLRLLGMLSSHWRGMLQLQEHRDAMAGLADSLKQLTTSASSHDVALHESRAQIDALEVTRFTAQATVLVRVCPQESSTL